MKKIIKEILNQNSMLKNEIKGLPDIGRRKDGEHFSRCISETAKSINFVSKETKKMERKLSEKTPKYSFASGDPLNYKPFKYSIKEMKKILNNKEQYKYPTISGGETERKKILEYLAKEGFVNNCPYKNSRVIINGLTLDNIAFTMSTTQAFSMVLDVILRPYDVIIIPGPNYSLFTFSAERIDACVEMIELKEDDDWLINPQSLRKKIDNINKKLEKKHKNSNIKYIPRVKAYLNCNPSNPTGKVLSEKNINILRELSEIANEKEIFIIDDMVYRDISYDKNNIAKPLATLPKNFENTITLLGLSKSYGLASARAGIVVADEIIIREIRNKLFQHMDSFPNIQIAALVGAFNASDRRYKYYNNYFSKLRNAYVYRYKIIVALIGGIDKIQDKKHKKKIIKLINNIIPKKDKDIILKNGIKGIKLINNMTPEAGFFTLIDFTELKNKKYKNIIIKTDRDLLEFFFCNKRVKFLIGSSFSFPSKNELIARITFALEPEELVKSFYEIYNAIKLLK